MTTSTAADRKLARAITVQTMDDLIHDFGEALGYLDDEPEDYAAVRTTWEERIALALAQARQEATLAERERCAGVAETCPSFKTPEGWIVAGPSEIAAAIRKATSNG